MPGVIGHAAAASNHDREALDDPMIAATVHYYGYWPFSVNIAWLHHVQRGGARRHRGGLRPGRGHIHRQGRAGGNTTVHLTFHFLSGTTVEYTVERSGTTVTGSAA